MSIKYKKVLITGGLGFIGSHLADILIDQNVQVVIIDNKTTNVVSEYHFSGRNSQVITTSIADTDLTQLKNIEVVFHLASMLGPTGLLQHAGDIALGTISDTVKLRDFCISNQIPLIDISTSEIYGHTGTLEETSQKIFPGEYQIRTEYGGSKMVAEMAICNKAKVDSRLKYHIIRPFNVTGPRQKPDGGFVLPRFVIAALTDQPITVYGDGTQRRAFTHVLDICDAILTIANSDNFNQIWNIGNPNNQMTIKDMAQKVIDITKKLYPEKNPQMIFVDPNTIHGKYFAEVVDKIPFIEKINSLLGWEPKINADYLFQQTIEFYADKVRNGYFFKVM